MGIVDYAEFTASMNSNTIIVTRRLIEERNLYSPKLSDNILLSFLCSSLREGYIFQYYF